MEEPVMEVVAVVEGKPREMPGMHAATVPATTAAEVHAATAAMHTAAATAVAATATAVSERRYRTGQCRGKRTRDEAAKELVVHPNVLRG